VTLPDTDQRKNLSSLWLWALPLAFLAVFFFTPLGAILKLGVQAVIEGSRLLLPGIWRPLSFTFGQAALSTILTLLVGLPAAYLFARYRFPGRRLLNILIVLPFMLPTVVAAAGFNALLGPSGWQNLLSMQVLHLAQPPIQMQNTLSIILLAHVFYNTPVIIRVMGSAWAQLDTRTEQAARVLGASPGRVLREITLPLLKPSVFSAALLVFLFNFSSFGVVLLLGGPKFATLEVEIYLQAMQMLNLPMAALLSAIQMLCTLGVTLLYQRINGAASTPLIPRLNDSAARHPRAAVERWFVGVMLIILLLLEFLPLLALALRSLIVTGADGSITWSMAAYSELFINRRQSIFYVPPIQAAVNSLGYGLATVLMALPLGALTVLAMRKRNRFSGWMDVVLMMPLGASAVTLGLGFIAVFNRPPLDVRSFPLLIPIAHTLVALPFVVRTLQPALASIPASLRHAAAVLGASPFQVWRQVELPILARAGVVSAIFSVTLSLGDFGATSFLARPETPTIPIAIARFLSLPGALNYGQSLAMATLLMLLCGLSIFAIEQVAGLLTPSEAAK